MALASAETNSPACFLLGILRGIEPCDIENAHFLG